MDNIRYPLGQFVPKSHLSEEERNQIIQQISGVSLTLKDTLKGLTEDQLQTPYRAGGWTVQQVVHHMADNDMNAYLRLKRALTEVEPLSDSYREDLWAELSDYKDVPIETSISLMELLHSRLTILLRGLQADDFARTLRTQVLGSITIEIALQRFVWHNYHHIAQIQSLRKKNGLVNYKYDTSLLWDKWYICFM
ncbi:MAG: putative metal-dependent hydrolase [Paenibacillus sp.]|nr:putative metal-dependent hydrolase [Paenibacillus sp.]